MENVLPTEFDGVDFLVTMIDNSYLVTEINLMEISFDTKCHGTRFHKLRIQAKNKKG